MAKIHKLYVYPLKEQPSLSDYLIGTNKRGNNKTQNFQISDILNLANIVSNSQSVILSGSITWVSGLTYYATTIEYIINGTFYVSPPTYITLDDADETLDRIDTFVVNTNNEVEVLTGVPSENPLEPTVDFSSQLRVTQAEVKAGETEPDGVEDIIIYDENLQEPDEWNTSSTENDPTFFFDSTNDVFTNTKSIQLRTVTIDEKMILSKTTPISLDEVTNLSFAFKGTAISVDTKITIEFKLNDNVFRTFIIQNGSYGFNVNFTDDYQIIDIPLSGLFQTGQEIDEINFYFTTIDNATLSVKVGYLDNIRFIKGLENPSFAGTYLALTDTQDTTYSNKADHIPSVNQQETKLVLTKLNEIKAFLTGANNLNLQEDTLQGLYNELDTHVGNLIAHVQDTNNPHNVTKSQLGLGNVDNTSDLDKPISNATQTALDKKLTKLLFFEVANKETTDPLSSVSGINKAYIKYSSTTDKVTEIFLTQELKSLLLAYQNLIGTHDIYIDCKNINTQQSLIAKVSAITDYGASQIKLVLDESHEGINESLISINDSIEMFITVLEKSNSLKSDEVQFSLIGTITMNSTDWYALGNTFRPRYNPSYVPYAGITDANAFADHFEIYQHTEKVPYKCKIKRVIIKWFVNGGGGFTNVKFRLRAYEEDFTGTKAFGNGYKGVNSVIAASRDIPSNFNNYHNQILEEGDGVIPGITLNKDSLLRIYLNSGGVNVPLQRFNVWVEYEEVL